jgi:hypothetical protein
LNKIKKASLRKVHQINCVGAQVGQEEAVADGLDVGNQGEPREPVIINLLFTIKNILPLKSRE